MLVKKPVHWALSVFVIHEGRGFHADPRFLRFCQAYRRERAFIRGHQLKRDFGQPGSGPRQGFLFLAAMTGSAQIWSFDMSSHESQSLIRQVDVVVGTNQEAGLGQPLVSTSSNPNHLFLVSLRGGGGKRVWL